MNSDSRFQWRRYKNPIFTFHNAYTIFFFANRFDTVGDFNHLANVVLGNSFCDGLGYLWPV